MKIVKEISLRSGIKMGLPPTSASIREETVRMEEHPKFSEIISDLQKDGYSVQYHNKNYAHVLISLLTSEDFCTVDKSINVVKNMRWLDLLHELIHVDQIETMITRGFMMYTDLDPKQKSPKYIRRELNLWQNDIFEFHARLIEFLRLHRNQTDPEVLKEHAEALPEFSRLFWRRGAKTWRSKTRYEWILEYFPDIFELRDEVDQILQLKFNKTLFIPAR